MRKLTQPWKLGRSFGSQPVGNVAGPRWPEAGITARVTSSQSSLGSRSEGTRPTYRHAYLAWDDHEAPVGTICSGQSSSVTSTSLPKVGRANSTTPCHSSHSNFLKRSKRVLLSRSLEASFKSLFLIEPVMKRICIEKYQ